MARINMMDVGVGVGVGALDFLMERQDTSAARTESFRTWTDISRLAVAGLGYLGQIFDFAPGISKALAMSATPLLTKSVMKAARLGATSAPSSAPSMRRAERVSAYQPGFQGVRVV